jgi:outer membrane protein OmpA-like peptidoglycan-associated protein
MVTAPDKLTLQLIFDAGVFFMGLLSGSFKKIAPPEMPWVWVILGTITASAAFFSSKLLFGLNSWHISHDAWFFCSLVTVGLAVICAVFYIFARFARTVTFEGETKLAGTAAEYRDKENIGKTPEQLVYDAGGVVGDIWTAEALAKSRRILGVLYTLFITLLALGLYLGMEAYNTPKPDPIFAEKIAKLRDVHFDPDKSDPSADGVALINDDAEILKDTFQQFGKATVILEGYCDDRGSDEHNFVLGYKRAEAVRQALLAAHVDKDKLMVSSHGKKESTCRADDEACRQKNRRVHLTAIQN